MLLISVFLICLLNLLTNQTNGYVLFAANLEDFRSIAKKFIPEKLADQLAEMASESSMKFNQKAVDKDEEYDNGESEREDATTRSYIEKSKENTKKRYEIQPKSKQNTIPKVNIDELVEKVRERLFKGGNKKRKATTEAKRQKYTDEDVTYTTESPNYDYFGKTDSQNTYETVSEGPKPEYYDEETTKSQKLQRIKPYKNKEQRQQIEQKDYESATQSDVEVNPTTKDGRIFQGVDLRNTNDSYEDYVTPSKDQIFESGETKNDQKMIALRQESVTEKQEYKRPHDEDYNDMKARTESLVYDDKEVRQIKTTDSVVRSKKTTKKRNAKGKGTMIPTREYYKMSSPDYYKKLPVIAEKYNFDEPIPERDREPENLKPIGNPPARINKKIKV